MFSWGSCTFLLPHNCLSVFLWSLDSGTLQHHYLGSYVAFIVPVQQLSPETQIQPSPSSHADTTEYVLIRNFHDSGFSFRSLKSLRPTHLCHETSNPVCAREQGFVGRSIKLYYADDILEQKIHKVTWKGKCRWRTSIFIQRIQSHRCPFSFKVRHTADSIIGTAVSRVSSWKLYLVWSTRTRYMI